MLLVLFVWIPSFSILYNFVQYPINTKHLVTPNPVEIKKLFQIHSFFNDNEFSFDSITFAIKMFNNIPSGEHLALLLDVFLQP